MQGKPLVRLTPEDFNCGESFSLSRIFNFPPLPTGDDYFSTYFGENESFCHTLHEVQFLISCICDVFSLLSQSFQPINDARAIYRQVVTLLPLRISYFSIGQAKKADIKMSKCL